MVARIARQLGPLMGVRNRRQSVRADTAPDRNRVNPILLARRGIGPGASGSRNTNNRGTRRSASGIGASISQRLNFLRDTRERNRREKQEREQEPEKETAPIADPASQAETVAPFIKERNRTRRPRNGSSGLVSQSLLGGAGTTGLL